ncbi:MAG: hypothetical protein ACJ72N_16910 [Labedaea sp.]
MIAALIPDTVGLAEAASPVALPLLPAVRRVERAGPVALLVATARMDRSGRVGERLLLRALGWGPGQRLDMDTMHGMIVIAAAPEGAYVVDARGAVTLPAALRHLCGIEPGLPLVLAAAVAEQVLVVHPADVVARLLAGHYTDLLGVGHDG